MASAGLFVRCIDEVVQITHNERNTMKSKITALCVTILLAGAVGLNAADAVQPKKGSPEFERMKSLVGTWTGKADMGQGPIDLNLQFRLLAGGSVVEERCFAGTPNEMVTMYYDRDG